MRRATALAAAVVILLAAWTSMDGPEFDGSADPAGQEKQVQAREETAPWLRSGPGGRSSEAAAAVNPAAPAGPEGRTAAGPRTVEQRPFGHRALALEQSWLPFGRRTFAPPWMSPPAVRPSPSWSVPRAARDTVVNPFRDAMKTLADLCAADGYPSPKAPAPRGDGVRNHWAVIAGVSDYAVISDLTYCDDDANLIEAALLAQPEWIAARITKLVDAQATKANISAAIANVAASCDDDDLVFFSFSGHGSTVADVAPLDEADALDETLCPYDTDFPVPDDATQIRDDELSAWMSAIPAGARIVMVIDTCHAGGNIKGVVKANVRGITGAGVPRKGDGFAKDLSRRKPRAPKGLIGPRDMDDVANNVTITACDDTETALELPAPIGQGLLSYYFLQGMAGQGPADTNRNARFSAEECFAYLQPLVIAEAAAVPHVQTPQMFDGFAGELEFLTRPGPEMDVQGNGQTIDNGDTSPRDGDHTIFGNAAVGVTLTRTFTIRSLGTSALNLTGAPAVTLSGAGAAEFAMVAQPATPVAGGASTTFQISFTPVSIAGARQATVSIACDDPDENPYTFSIEGSTKLRWRTDDRGGSGGGGCSLASGPASAEAAFGWALPYLILAALYAVGRFRRRESPARPRG